MVRGPWKLLARAKSLASADLPRFLAVLGGAGACAGLFLAGVYAWGSLQQPSAGRVAVITPHRTAGPRPPTGSPTPAPPAPEPTSAPPSGPAPLRSPAPGGSVLADRTGDTVPGGGGAPPPVTTQEPQPAPTPSAPAPAPPPSPSPAPPLIPAVAPLTAPPPPAGTATPAVSIGLDLPDLLDLQLNI